MQILDPSDKRIMGCLATCTPYELGDPRKGEAFEKKNARQISKAIKNVESGKAKYIALTPPPGK